MPEPESCPEPCAAAKSRKTFLTFRSGSAWLGFWLLLFCLAAPALFAVETPAFDRTEDVIYGRKFGTALTLDVFRPKESNGLGLIWIVSGGWYSSHDAINAGFCLPFLQRGYTVFAVVHGSQPKFCISEIEPDIHRAVRFIRHNAATYHINPDKLGIYGGSAGGHLTLTIATQGGPGDPAANDPVERESSAVQCAACFFPPTDFLNYSRTNENAIGLDSLKEYRPAFGPRAATPEGREALGREISPIYYVHSNQPPILIIHGTADKLVPIFQSERFVARCEAAHAEAKLILREGKGHGWPELGRDLEVFADWFDQHLRNLPPK